MRTLLAIVALAIGCANKDPRGSDRPSFYDTNNSDEYYGRCPKCQQWVKGYRGHWHGTDATGKLVGGGLIVTGTCPSCNVWLFTDNSVLTNRSRIVRWSRPN